jgi:DNA-binding transcriptional regulator YdaS (Cro superfamily)
MKTKDAIAHFGTASQLAAAVGISKAAVSQWGDHVPLGTAALIEKLTDGAVTLDPSCYRRRLSTLPAFHHEAA